MCTIVKDDAIEKIMGVLIDSPPVIRKLMDNLLKKLLRAPDINISRYHFEVLKTLDVFREMSISELGEMLVISKSQMTRLINELSGTGKIVRTPDPNDRRKTMVSLTDKGQDCISRVMDRFYQTTREKLQPLSNQDLDDLLISLDKISQLLHKIL